MADSYIRIDGSKVASDLDPATGINTLKTLGSGGTGGSAQQVQGNVAAGAADSGNPVKAGGVNNTTLPTLTNGQRGDLQLGTRGALNVTLWAKDSTNFAALAAPTNGQATQTALYVVAQGVMHNGATWDYDRKPNATSRIVSAAASTNATVAKASAGDAFRVSGYNANAAPRYLKIYNKATAPTVGTDTPVWTEYLAPQSKFELSFQKGFYLSAGIAYALTTGSADSDTGALTAGDILGLNLAYA